MENKNKSLEEMMKAASEANVDDIKPPKQSKKKRNLIIGGMCAGVFLVGLGVYKAPSFNNQEFVDKTQTPDNIASSGTAVNDSQRLDKGELSLELEDWQLTGYNFSMLEEEEAYAGMLTYADRHESLRDAISWLPSSIDLGIEGAPKPYTSDPIQEYIENEDGEFELNPRYVDFVQEDIKIAYSVYVNRLINPEFGMWGHIQSIEGRNIAIHPDFGGMKDMFTDEWWAENIKVKDYNQKDYSKLPILADWDGSRFTGFNLKHLQFQNSGVLYGEVFEDENNKVEVSPVNLNHEERTITIKSPIRYEGLNKNNEEIVLLYNLTIGLRQDKTRLNKIKFYIDYAELTEI